MFYIHFPSHSPSSSSNKEYKGRRTLYHATKFSAADSILTSGKFIPGSSGCVGGGIYFADNESAARHKCIYKGSECVVIQATVDLGTALVIRGGADGTQYNESQLRNMGCESIYLPNGARGGNAGAEYVVFNTNQVSNLRIHSGNPYVPLIFNG